MPSGICSTIISFRQIHSQFSQFFKGTKQIYTLSLAWRFYWILLIFLSLNTSLLTWNTKEITIFHWVYNWAFENKKIPRQWYRPLPGIPFPPSFFPPQIHLQKLCIASLTLELSRQLQEAFFKFILLYYPGWQNHSSCLSTDFCIPASYSGGA